MQKVCNSEDGGLNDALKLARRIENDGVVASAALGGHVAGSWAPSSAQPSASRGRKKDAPTATHLVEYKEKETRTKKLVGKAATELSADKYGAAEWWLLLEPVEC